MSKVEAVAEEVGIDIRALDITQIEANAYNPNEIEAQLFETLVEAVKSEGMNQPILVRPKPGVENVFEIVDGEHRFNAARIAGIAKVAAVVVPYDENMAKVRTLSYNAIKGQNVPIKLARLITDLQRTYSDKEIRAMTGIAEDEQQSVLQLLKVPEFRPDHGVHITTEQVDRPIEVKLMLMPDEHAHYTSAMKKALKLGGEEVTPLVGGEVENYHKAMNKSMGLLGVKLRNIALATICDAFNSMNEDQQKKVAERMKKAMMDKITSDAQAKVDQQEKADRAVPAARKRTRTAQSA